MNLKETEDYYTNIIEQVTREISNKEEHNRSPEALDEFKKVRKQFFSNNS